MKIVFGGDVSVMEDCRALFEAGDHEALFVTDGKVRVAVIAVCEHEYSYALPHRMEQGSMIPTAPPMTY